MQVPGPNQVVEIRRRTPRWPRWESDRPSTRGDVVFVLGAKEKDLSEREISGVGDGDERLVSTELLETPSGSAV